MPLSEDKRLEILHDHYKETFARIREVEQTRNKLFMWVIGLFAVLIFEIGYPAELGQSVGKVGILGMEFDLKALPLAALLNVTWVLTFAIALRYCQVTVLINRQYPYLHDLEDAISPQVGGGDLYRREGDVYKRKYPLLLDVVWIAYAFIFPFIVMFAAVALTYWEYTKLPYTLPHRVFDSFMAGTIVLFFFLYCVWPGLVTAWGKVQSWCIWLKTHVAAWQSRRKQPPAAKPPNHPVEPRKP